MQVKKNIKILTMKINNWKKTEKYEHCCKQQQQYERKQQQQQLIQ